MSADMEEILDLHLKHFIKVKVKTLTSQSGERRNTCEHFTIDPLTTNYSKLRNLLARIFNIEGEFTISFRKDKSYIPLTSDWDLDGAICEASKPCLVLAIDIQPMDKSALEEWDIICPADIPPMEPQESRSSQERKSLAGSIISQVEMAILIVQRAFNFETNQEFLSKYPMDKAEYRSLLDSDGRLVCPRDLNMSVYQGGVDPAIRSTVWKHLLNVFPCGLTEKERDAFMSTKCEEYYQLRYRWQHLLQTGTIPDVLQDITTMVRKDVRRTDRSEKFYSGSDESDNVRALYNILTTYAVNHPNISYCQGMSDMLSPILYVMKKESVAYVCFCALMKRTHRNFRLDGRTMKIKFRHLQKMLRFYDQELYLYFKDQEALDMLFCYRWLLLELKREFPFNEMLNMMEILWSSLPPRPPFKDLDMYEVKFPTAAICSPLKDRTRSQDYLRVAEDYFGTSQDHHSLSHSMTTFATNQKLKKWALRVRRESIARNIDINDSSGEEEIKLPVHYRKRKYRSYIAGKLGRLNKNNPTADLAIRSCRADKKKNSVFFEICQSWSCGEVFEDKPQLTAALCDAREFLRNQWCYSNTVNEIQLNNWLNGRHFEIKECAIGHKDDNCTVSNSDSRKRHGSSDSNYGTISEDFSDSEDETCRQHHSSASRKSHSEGYMSDTDSKHQVIVEEDEVDYDTDEDDDFDDYSDDFMDSMAGQQYEEVQKYFDRKKEMLPAPHILGDGNPFLLFLCISMIQYHRTEILKRKLDFNELGIYFDRLVRKHKLAKVMKNAQKMFKEYLNMGWDVDDGDLSDDAANN